MISTSQTQFSETLLRMPQWLGVPEEMSLPAPPRAYRVVQLRPDWFEVHGPDGQVVYSGLGPVQILPACNG